MQMFWLLNIPYNFLRNLNLHRICQGYAAVENILMKLLEVIKYSTTPPKPKYSQGGGKGHCFISSKNSNIQNILSNQKANGIASFLPKVVICSTTPHPYTSQNITNRSLGAPTVKFFAKNPQKN